MKNMNHRRYASLLYKGGGSGNFIADTCQMMKRFVVVTVDKGTIVNAITTKGLTSVEEVTAT